MQIVIKDMKSGLFLSSQKSGLIAVDRIEAQAWETFEVVSDSGGVLTLQCKAHKHGALYKFTMNEMTGTRSYLPFVLPE